MKNVGGNKFFYSVGKMFVSLGNSMINRNKSKVITNMSFEFINPFTLMINFVIDNTEKFQIIKQGDFKEKYIEWSKSNKEESNSILNEDQLFILITENRSKWFKKN